MKNKNENKYKNKFICNDFSYCIDANYWKGITPQNFIKKHKRQLIIEVKDNESTKRN